MFASYGVEEGGEEQFRKEVAENMARELKNAVQCKGQAAGHGCGDGAHESLEVPKSLIAQEIDAMRQQMFQQFGGAGAPGPGSEVPAAR